MRRTREASHTSTTPLVINATFSTTPVSAAATATTSDSNVTRAIYRAHFDNRRRESLRASMETRMETSVRGRAEESLHADAAEVVNLQQVRDAGT